MGMKLKTMAMVDTVLLLSTKLATLLKLYGKDPDLSDVVFQEILLCATTVQKEICLLILTKMFLNLALDQNVLILMVSRVLWLMVVKTLMVVQIKVEQLQAILQTLFLLLRLL